MISDASYRGPWLWGLALAGLLLLAAPPAALAAAPETVGLQQAASQGAVSYRFQGLGKTVGGTLTLSNLTDRPLKIVIPTGTVFNPADNETQPMITGKNPPIVLKPGGTWQGPVSTFCTDHFRPPPSAREDGPPVTLGPRTPLTDELTGLIISRDEVEKELARDPKRPKGPWEERDPEGFWDTALLWAIYGAAQKIGQATYQETMENQFSEQVSEPRAKQESRNLAGEVFTAVHQIEDEWIKTKEDEVDLTELDPTLKYRPPMKEKPAAKAVPSWPGSFPPEAVAGQAEDGGRSETALWLWQSAFSPPMVLAAEETKELDLSNLDSTQKYRKPKKTPDAVKPPVEVKKQEPAVGDVFSVDTFLTIPLPTAPMVNAYMLMAAEAHDRYGDLDAAHDWLERALELDPYNRTARAMLDRVEAAKQQVGLQRMGVALGTLQQMLIREQLEEERRQEEWEEQHLEEGRHPPEEEEPPPEELP